MSWRFAIATGFAAIVACQGTAPHAPQTQPEFKTLTWVDSTADLVAHLTQQPATCLSAPTDAAVRRGELLFNSPLLLGGQAAKAGLSCAACHRNGRGNPDFVFAGISGAPGTADVTSGLFSKVRADQVFNPVTIPDLAAPDGRVMVDRDQEGALEAFLSAQIIEEFSGAEPDKAVIADLAAYIRSLGVAACDAASDKTQTWSDEMVRLRVGADHLASERSEPAPAYRLAMRAALGRLHERYPASLFEDTSKELVALGRALSGPVGATALNARLDALERDLKRGERHSYYNEAQLARMLR